ncbi:hypothetical protein G5I_09436 [Acromyrmex echinatior]|uniref:Uncharacterized protein n=1 Tax=Acromyrmex echinatior TaxID=103372 RepID=F4WU79_ACREC|nr:hypothetical protein G5I_09436 [Acromyrmex echinatior]
MNDQEIYGLGESAGVNRFEDKSLAGNVRIVPPTPVAYKTSVEMSERSLQSRKAMMQQMDEPVRFIRLLRSKKRDKTNTAANPVIKVCEFWEPNRSQLKLVLYEDEPTALISLPG